MGPSWSLPMALAEKTAVGDAPAVSRLPSIPGETRALARVEGRSAGLLERLLAPLFPAPDNPHEDVLDE